LFSLLFLFYVKLPQLICSTYAVLLAAMSQFG